MKKVLALILCAVLMTTLCITAFAVEPEFNCTASDTDVQTGETFTITVSISGYEPIRGGALLFELDTDVFEVVSGEWLIAKTALAQFDPVRLTATFASASFAAQDINGDIFRLTLKAKTDLLSAGDANIKITPQLTNADDENVAAGVSETTVVTVSCSEHKYGDLIPEVPAKCGVEGKKAYYECSICHKLFDEDLNEVTEVDLVIPALSHVAEDNWHSDEDNHWKVCANAGCGAVIDGTMAVHSFEWIVDKAATEDTPGIQHEECSVCGYRRNENTEIPQLPHVHTGITHHEDVSANCHETGNVEYWTCSSDKCAGKYYSNADCTTEIPTITVPIDPDNHAGGTEIRGAVEATCSTDGYTGDTYCLGCKKKIAEGTVIPETGIHTDADGKWESDEADHWHTCDCGEIFDKAAHEGGEATCSAKAVCEVCGTEYGELDPDNHANTEIRGAVAATEEAEGYTGDKWCLDCDQMIEEGKVIAELDHTHDMVRTEAKPATHEEDGNIEYYTCSKCGKKYNNEAGTRELTDEEIIIEAAGHSYSTEWKSDADSHWHECTCGERIDQVAHAFGDWTVTKEATATADGSRERKCSVCGYLQSEKISATGGTTDDTESGGTDSSGDSDTPQTGDNTNAFLWLALMAAGGCGLIVTMFARKRYGANR